MVVMVLAAVTAPAAVSGGGAQGLIELLDEDVVMGSSSDMAEVVLSVQEGEHLVSIAAGSRRALRSVEAASAGDGDLEHTVASNVVDILAWANANAERDPKVAFVDDKWVAWCRAAGSSELAVQALTQGSATAFSKGSKNKFVKELTALAKADKCLLTSMAFGNGKFAAVCRPRSDGVSWSHLVTANTVNLMEWVRAKHKAGEALSALAFGNGVWGAVTVASAGAKGAVLFNGKDAAEMQARVLATTAGTGARFSATQLGFGKTTFLAQVESFPLDAGTECEAAAECSAGVCAERCCAPGAGANCASCDAAGACTACDAGSSLSLALGACLRDDGAECAADGQCMSGDCQSGHCCAGGVDAHCGSCSAAGVCDECAAGFTLAGAACKLDAGASCAASLAGACLSGACLTGNCCAAGVDPNCDSCGSSGQCNSCTPGFRQVGAACMATSGGECAADGDCLSGDCQSGHCCAGGVDAHCDSCSAAGVCDECAAGFSLAGAKCLRDGGRSCDAQDEGACLSGACLAGRCCSVDQPECRSCSSSGACTSCEAGFAVVDGQCKVSDGGECGSGAACGSGLCHGRRCCAADVTGCDGCDASGACDSCGPFFSLTNGGQCVKTRSGGSCVESDACASGACRDGKCCSSADVPNCNGCSSSGRCDSCDAGFSLVDGQCKLPHGGSCAASGPSCVSGLCRGSNCCSSDVANCDGCSSSGACDSCSSGWSLVGGLCKKDDGDVCGSNSQCSSGLCQGSNCCSSSVANCDGCNGNGACDKCDAGFSLVNGQCIKLASGGTCDSNAVCSSGLCRGSNCCSSNVEHCNGCSNSGACDSCSSNFRLVNGQCSKASDGGSCSSGASCSSGLCRGSNCCAANVAHCNGCSGSGACDSCDGGFSVVDGQCKKNGGGVCSANSVCKSGLCRDFNCCSEDVANCNGCSGNGSCDNCASGFSLVNGQCIKIAVGGVCGSSSVCSSGLCRGSNCCSSNVEHCNGCSRTGACDNCDSGFWLVGGECIKITTGGSCSSNAMCSSGFCRGSNCCSEDVANCNGCSSSGACDNCNSGWWVDDGQCKRGDGGSCSSSSTCLSGLCRDSRCCSSNVANCNGCSSNGSCDSCNSGYSLSNGQCNADKTSNGGSCSSSSACSSGLCRDFRCCSSNVANCNGCSSNGSCDSCNSGYSLSNGQCNADGNDDPSLPSGYKLLNYGGYVNVLYKGPSQYAGVMEAAAKVWDGTIRDRPSSQVVTRAEIEDCGKVSYPGNSITFSGILIIIRLEHVDGRNGALATAGPCRLRSSDGLPYLGQVRWDEDDIDARSNEDVTQITVHEIAHSLGLGTIWFGDVPDAFGSNPKHRGSNARAAYSAIGGSGDVPVANINGKGQHWREADFDREVFTPVLLLDRANPLSRVTIGALADLGYSVDYSGADDYSLGRRRELSDHGHDHDHVHDHVHDHDGEGADSVDLGGDLDDRDFAEVTDENGTVVGEVELPHGRLRRERRARDMAIGGAAALIAGVVVAAVAFAVRRSKANNTPKLAPAVPVKTKDLEDPAAATSALSRKQQPCALY